MTLHRCSIRFIALASTIASAFLFVLSNLSISTELTSLERLKQSQQVVQTPANISIIEYNALEAIESVGKFPCIKTHLENLTFPVCTYEAQEDKYISKLFLEGKYFEDNFVLNIIRCLQKDSRLQFLDIGANLGVYTLPVAQMRRKVLSIEPNIETMRRLKTSVYLGNATEYVTLLHNAVSNTHVSLNMGVDLRNRGHSYLLQTSNCTEADPRRCQSYAVNTLTMDDLIPLMTSDRTVIKADVEGEEINVFSSLGATKFFDTIHVPYIFMEWLHYQKRFLHDGVQRELVDDWLKFFYARNYSVHHPNTGAVLGEDWNQWPTNVIFRKT